MRMRRQGEVEWERNTFHVEMGVHQGSVLSPLLFIIVLEVLSREFRKFLSLELPNADNLVLIAEMEELCMEKLRKWKKGMEMKGHKSEFWWCQVNSVQ